jgi:hypothetical protein
MKKLVLITFAFLMVSGLQQLQCAPEGSEISIKGILVLASNQGEGLDPSLKAYGSQLRRLNFSSYRAIGGGGTRIRITGEGVINLGKGYTVEIKASSAPGRNIPVNIRWMAGKKMLMHTSGKLPFVMGGPPFQGGNLILVLDGR